MTKEKDFFSFQIEHPLADVHRLITWNILFEEN